MFPSISNETGFAYPITSALFYHHFSNHQSTSTRMVSPSSGKGISIGFNLQLVLDLLLDDPASRGRAPIIGANLHLFLFQYPNEFDVVFFFISSAS